MKTDEELIWESYSNRLEYKLENNIQQAESKWKKYYEGIVRSVYIPHNIDVSDEFVEKVKSMIDKYGEIISKERRMGKLAVKVGFETEQDFLKFKNQVDTSIVMIDGSEDEFNSLIEKYVRELKQPHDVKSVSHNTLRLLWNKYGREKTERKLEQIGV